MSSTTNNTAPPSSFRYRKVLEKGKPVHDKYDSFFLRHPAMNLSRRAKIFSPFDALKGFSDELTKTRAEVTDTFPDETEPVRETP